MKSKQNIEAALEYVRENPFEYGTSLYENESLRNYAIVMLDMLPEDTTLLISGGSSGCSIASAMCALSNTRKRLCHLHFYSKGINTHRGLTVEKKYSGYSWVKRDHCVIVDDCIDTGSTVSSILSLLWERNTGIDKTPIILRCTGHENYPMREFKCDTVEQTEGRRIFIGRTIRCPSYCADLYAYAVEKEPEGYRQRFQEMLVAVNKEYHDDRPSADAKTVPSEPPQKPDFHLPF